MPSRETTSSHASIGRLLLADYRGWSHQEEWGVARQGGGGVTGWVDTTHRLGGHKSHNSQAQPPGLNTEPSHVFLINRGLLLDMQHGMGGTPLRNRSDCWRQGTQLQYSVTSCQSCAGGEELSHCMCAGGGELSPIGRTLEECPSSP